MNLFTVLPLLLLYALIFVFVVWPIHWMWHVRTRPGPYDRRFYRQASYWRLYAIVFGTALAAVVVILWSRGYM